MSFEADFAVLKIPCPPPSSLHPRSRVRVVFERARLFITVVRLGWVRRSKNQVFVKKVFAEVFSFWECMIIVEAIEAPIRVTARGNTFIVKIGITVGSLKQ